MKKTLYLMRHAQTLFNVQHRIQGWCDSPLTEMGKKQAERAGEFFKQNGIVPDHFYTSTSERCSDTLELAMGQVPYTRLKGLKEWNFGIIEAESERLNPPLPYGDFFKTYYHGEGEMEVRQRMADTLAEVMAKPDHSVVLAVSHGGSSFAFLRYWAKNQRCEVKPPKSGISNCAIFEYEYEDGEFSLIAVHYPDFSGLEG